MATLIDATASIYKLINDFIEELKNDTLLPEFTFVSTTSLEAAYLALKDTDSKIVIVQKEQTTLANKFTKIVYTLVPSFSGDSTTTDYNSILTMKVVSKFSELYPRYSAMEVFDAFGLMANPSTFTSTTRKMVISDIRQEILGASQLRNNFNALEVTFLGYLG